MADAGKADYLVTGDRRAGLLQRGHLGRTRPAHRAMDNFIAPIDDPIWQKWSAPAGFRCRCSTRTLTEAQAVARGYKPGQVPPDAAPDKGWDYDKLTDHDEALQRLVAQKLGKVADRGLREAAEKALRNNGRMHADINNVSQFLSSALGNRRAKQPPLALKSVLGGIAASLETLGAKPRTRDFALDHDYVLHIYDGHGLDKERLRGQEPITAEDLLKVGDLIENALSINPGTPAHSRNGAMRVEAYAEDGDFAYGIVLEVRRQHVVPFTMHKRRK